MDIKSSIVKIGIVALALLLMVTPATAVTNNLDEFDNGTVDFTGGDVNEYSESGSKISSTTPTTQGTNYEYFTYKDDGGTSTKEGDTIKVQLTPDVQSSDQAGFFYGLSNSKAYAVEIKDGGSVWLRTWDVSTKTMTSYHTTIASISNPNQELNVEVEWNNDGSHKVSIYDSSSTLLDSGTWAGDNARTSGGYGLLLIDGDPSNQEEQNNPSASAEWDYYRVERSNPVQSVDVSIDGNTSQYNTTGSNDFEVNATATFKDSSTKQVSEDSSSTYTYNSTQLNQLSPKDRFEGNNAGKDDITISYTGPEGNTVTDTITVKVEDPPDVQSISLTGLNSNYDEGDSDSLTATVTYTDSTSTDVTSSSTWASNNSTRMTVDSSGGVDALFYGSVTITVSYTDSWHSTTVTDSSTTTILGDPSSVDFTVSDTNPRVNDSVDMSAILNYEDGRNKDVTNDISSTTVTSNKPARTDFDFANTSVSFNDNVNFTLTFTNTYQGNTLSDNVDVDVRPARNYKFFNSLSVVEQVWVIFTDWSLLSIIASTLAGAMVAIKYGGGAAMATTTMLLGLCWVGGLVSIFVPATLILFEIFIITVTDFQDVKSR